MNLNHLTDAELIDYVLAHSTDPIQLRLATIMDRFSGGLLSELEHAGMERGSIMEFQSEHNMNWYSPGMYICHLRDELSYYQDEYSKSLNEIESLKARTVIELIDELRQSIARSDSERDAALRRASNAIDDRDQMQNKMKVWRALSTDTTR